MGTGHHITGILERKEENKQGLCLPSSQSLDKVALLKKRGTAEAQGGPGCCCDVAAPRGFSLARSGTHMPPGRHRYGFSVNVPPKLMI